MSISSEITRISDNIEDAYLAAEEKGATMPATQNSDNLPSAIRSIQTGVQSVNGKTGVVELGKSDVGLGNVDNIRQYSVNNPPPYPVQSVNGQTGAVSIDIPSGVAVQDDTPIDDTLVWVDTDDSSAFHTIPEIDDNNVSSSDTWSSQKINTMFSTGTSNGWTYYKIGTTCFAWYYKQLTGVDLNSSWSGLYYRSGEIEAAPYPTFLADGYKFSAALAGGSQNGGVTLGRIMDTNSALRVYLMATGSVTGANCAVMVFATGTWNG